MITHGKKQISEIVYARKSSEGGGTVRLTNIIRGAQVVFGGLEPKVAWLTKATRAAILAAFGQDDGYAVLGETNAYLNALAATDPTKATAIAGFINEDPMLVVSLVETSKVRYIQNTQGAYINTGIIPTEHTLLDFDTMVAWKDMDKYEECLFASIGNSYSGTDIYGLVFHTTNRSASFMCGLGDKGAATGLAKTIKRTKIEGKHNGNGIEVYVNDIYTKSGITNTLSNKPIWIFLPNGHYWNLVSGYNAVYQLEYLRFSENKEDIAHFIPMQRTDGTCGMLDIIRCTFYTKANTKGAFTISLTDKQ